jgi:hypothetical protein
VIEQLRERAGYPLGTDSVLMETDLRRLLDEAAENPDKNFLAGCKEEQYAVRIAIPGRNAVYAILRRPSRTEGRRYDFVVPTVLTPEMYSVWNKDGKLETVNAVATRKRPAPVLKPQLHLRWANKNGEENFGDYCADDVPEQIRKLLNKGVVRETIRVYKNVPFRIEVSLTDDHGTVSAAGAAGATGATKITA